MFYISDPALPSLIFCFAPLSCRVSVATPPQTIAPSRPFPMGIASVQCFAGPANLSFNGFGLSLSSELGLQSSFSAGGRTSTHSPSSIAKTSASLFSSSKTLASKPSFTSLSLKLHNHRPKSLRFSNTSKPTITATIAVGDKLPDATLSYFDPAGELQTTTISDLTKNKKAILFAVPGAFTPTCSQKHLPGFVEKSKDLKAKGVDTIACISVNDAFVMKAWRENLNIKDEVLLLSDGNGDFTRAIGCELDLSDKPVGLGVRSRRYALLAENGVVKLLNLEEGGAFTFSGAEDMLKAL